MNNNKLSAERIVELYENLEQTIEETFDGTQKDNIFRFLEHFKDRILETPASAKISYHNCFPGGLLDHTLRVIETSLFLAEYINTLGAKHTHTKKDIVLASMFHAAGKLGD